MRRSTRARRVRVTVNRDGVTVVLPQRASAAAADHAVVELDGWIRARLAEQDEALAHVSARGGRVLWRGDLAALTHEDGRTQARFDGERFLVPRQAPHAALERLYRREARREIAGLLDKVTAQCGTNWSSLRVGDMRTRWASCSAGGKMSFSWRLMMAPPQVLESVVWHEVCHIEEPNHSPRFWALLDSRRPTNREDRAWLDRHAAELVF